MIIFKENVNGAREWKLGPGALAYIEQDKLHFSMGSYYYDKNWSGVRKMILDYKCTVDYWSISTTDDSVFKILIDILFEGRK